MTTNQIDNRKPRSQTELAEAQGGELHTVRKRHPIRLALAVIIALYLARLVVEAFTNPRFQWEIVGQYLFYPSIMQGLGRTLVLTFAAMAIGIFGGVVLAVMRPSKNPLVSGVAAAYIWFFRGTPLLVQLIFWYNLSALFPKIVLGVPFGPEFFSFSANDVINIYVAALLGLGLNEAAYMAEIIRTGISSVDSGQSEAAHALGMSRWSTFTRIVMPQAMRIIVPPTSNQVIGMLKTTSLVSVIALPDLLYSAQLIYNRDFTTIPLLIVTCVWYLVLTTVLSIGQHYIERYYNRGHHRPVVSDTEMSTLTAPVTMPRREGEQA